LSWCSGVEALKTGYITLSGFNLAVVAKRGSHRIIVVVLGFASAIERDIYVSKLTNMLLETGKQTLRPPNLARNALLSQINQVHKSNSPSLLSPKKHPSIPQPKNDKFDIKEIGETITIQPKLHDVIHIIEKEEIFVSAKN
jgi:D-alanyl-D-alanine carboxypeptidase